MRPCWHRQRSPPCLPFVYTRSWPGAATFLPFIYILYRDHYIRGHGLQHESGRPARALLFLVGCAGSTSWRSSCSWQQCLRGRLAGPGPADGREPSRYVSHGVLSDIIKSRSVGLTRTPYSNRKGTGLNSLRMPPVRAKQASRSSEAYCQYKGIRSVAEYTCVA